MSDTGGVNDLDPEAALSREVYAYFGLAYYLSECVHRGLVNVYAVLPFTPKTATRPRIEERTMTAERWTLGELVTHTKPLLPVELHSRMDWTVQKRNFLAHGFWYERIHLMSSETGKNELLAELQQAENQFRQLNEDIDATVFAHWRQLGITDAHLEEAINEVRNGVPEEATPTRAIPKTEETIEMKRVWVLQGRGSSTLMFQSTADEIWQLCDVGLGWCYSEPDSSWKPFDELTLPAKIVARPKSAKPWSYKLHVSTGALICVGLDEKSGKYTWRIERTSPKGPNGR